MKTKRKIRRWGIIDLYETSVVGIGAYPDAHMASSYSLLKSLSKVFESDKKQLNLEEAKMAEEEETQTQAVEDTQDEVQPEPVEVPEETQEEPKEEAEKSFTAKDVKELISKAIKDALESSKTERGFVEADKVEDFKDKSLGEIALMMSK